MIALWLSQPVFYVPSNYRHFTDKRKPWRAGGWGDLRNSIIVAWWNMGGCYGSAQASSEYIAEPMSRDAKRCPQGNTTLLSELCTWRAVWSVTAAAKVSPELTRRGGNKRVKPYTAKPCALRRAERSSARCPRLRGHYACHAETTMTR